MEQSHVYQYSALSDPESIRLLTISPSQLISDSLRCEIHHTRLSLCNESLGPARQSYTALSYVWGNADNPIKSISLGSKILLAGDDLYDALRHLRMTDQPMYL